MKRLLLLTVMILAPLYASAQESNYILLECSSSNPNKIITISIDKTSLKANIEYRVKESVKERLESLPVEFTENEIKITEEYSTEKLAKIGSPEGVTLSTQFRISRKSLVLEMYASMNGKSMGKMGGGDSICSLQKSNNSGNRI